MKISSLIASLLVSVCLVFLLFCIFWAAIFANYINYYGIREFFNPFFGNVFNPFVFVLMVLGFGIAFIIPLLGSIARIFYVVLFFLCLILFVPILGNKTGEIILSSNKVIQINGVESGVYSLYENRFYIFYLKDPLNGKETLEERKKKIAYYEKPES
ncbi:hypothetical protein [Helicobacter sp.]|uniref:hypothetical protein n=1 Tax=Helicobacter sp. TaxID=218 RepID=UPI00258937B8|nr:hypothetical protein [Helicobacter sp.]MCI7047952.1 hypothetical protein [Helicobacter sp.]